MKVLLDENIPHALRHELSQFDVFTVQYLGWSGLKNGALLTRAAAADFDLMVTMDSGIPYQRNSATLPLALVVLSAPSNDLSDIQPLVPALKNAISNIVPNTVVTIR